MTISEEPALGIAAPRTGSSSNQYSLETSMMTDNPEDLQHYWSIPIPKHKFPKPKFYLGQQVGLSWEDEFGNCFYDIGEIVGMQYVAEGKRPAQWYYRMRFLRCTCEPWLVGKYDELFEPESCLVADDTVIED